MSSKKIAAAAAVGTAAVGTAAVGTAVAVKAARKAVRTSSGHADPTRWRVVTVNRRPDDVRTAALPPLDAWGDRVEVRTQAAPGDKGTELWARWREGVELPDEPDAARTLRTALREAKQLLEVGWILEADRNTTAQETPLNAPLRKAIKVAGGEGLL